MPLSSPSNLCWNVIFPPEQEWIEKTLHVAIKTIWQRARNTARTQFGDESLAVEIMEVAIEKAINRLKEGPPVGSDEASLLLDRFYAQEARRRRKANRKLTFLGSSAELPSNPVQNPLAPVDSAIDLDVILQGTPPEVRLALLLRHSRARWSEVAEILGTSAASIRVRCQRALKKIRHRLGISEHGK
jgi:DNA-directed RNA polymerase specialized sigma24 family protein